MTVVDTILTILDARLMQLYADAAVFERGAWSVLGTTTLVLVYLALAFVLPNQIPFMTEAAHIATLHSIIFAIAGVLLAATLRYSTGSEAAQLDFVPVTPILAALPFVCITLTNAILLPVLGVESWLRDELQSHFSVLAIVQMLACAEAAAVTMCSLLTVVRLCKYRSMYPYGATVSIRHTKTDVASEYGSTMRYSADGTPHTVSFAAALANVSAAVDETSTSVTVSFPAQERRASTLPPVSSPLPTYASSSSVNADPPKRMTSSFADTSFSSPPPAVAAALSPGGVVTPSTPMTAVPVPGTPTLAAPHELVRLREVCFAVIFVHQSRVQTYCDCAEMYVPSAA